MQLVLFRHGIAEDASPQGDGARRLTKEGVEKTRQAARGLARILDAPQVLFTSPLVRAVQTAELLAEEIKLRPRVMPALASGSAQMVLEEVRRGSESLVVLVGHEPTLSALGAMLCAGDGTRFIELKKAGAILIETGTSKPTPGAGQLLWLATPAMLRGLAG